MPQVVLEELQANLLDYEGRGLSVMEMSHRSSDFAEIAGQAHDRLKRLLNVPDHYRILFMQGGASAQFAHCIVNLDHLGKVAYANTGYWAKKAISVAENITSVSSVMHMNTDPLTEIPPVEQWQLSNNHSFLHITENETIDGVAYDQVPGQGGVLVADMSSSILSKPINVNDYGMIYAGAQKNIGPAGITVVIIRDDLLERSSKMSTPAFFNYAKVAEADSMLNTPPTFAWYASGLVFKWLEEQGGLGEVATRNQQKAQRVYETIDANAMYLNTVHPRNRSLMNIPFQLQSDVGVAAFLNEADKRGLIGLKGHKSVGGFESELIQCSN